MKRFIVFKFLESEIYIYISEAQNAELASTLLFGNTICIGNFVLEESYGKGEFAIELHGDIYDVSWLTKPLEWYVENQMIIQNNN